MSEHTRPALDAQNIIGCLQSGHAPDRNALVNAVHDRLRRLASLVLHRNDRLRSRIESPDLFQDLMCRLLEDFDKVQPATVEEFYRWGAHKIRQLLHDLVRHDFGPEGSAANRAPGVRLGNSDSPSGIACTIADSGSNPLDAVVRREAWAKLDAAINELPSRVRDVFMKKFYCGLTFPQIVEVSGISESTAKREWQHAMAQLGSVVGELF